MPGLREVLREWFQSVTEARATEARTDELLPPRAEDAPDALEANARLQARAVVGIFILLALYFLYFAAPIIIPIVSAVLLSMLLAPLVRLLELVRVPRALGSLVVVLATLGAFLGIGVSLREPMESWLTDTPQRFSRLEEKLHPITAIFGKMQAASEQLERATTPKHGPIVQKVELARSGLSGVLSSGSPHVASTIVAVIGLLYLFLISGDTFLRKLVTVIPTLKDKKRAVEIIRNIENDISFYLVLITIINIAIGFAVAATTAVLGIANPLLWGTLATVLSFAPYVGEFAIVALLALAGLLSFDNLAQAVVAPLIYFVLMTICWQGVVPFVVGRRLTLSPVAVFIMIMLLGWMWGVIGALVAVPVLASLKIICDRIQSLRPISEFLNP